MPRPVKRPAEPGPGECCGSGCARCVWDVYFDRLSEYEQTRQKVRLIGEEVEKMSSSSADSSLSEESETVKDYIGSVVLKHVEVASVEEQRRNEERTMSDLGRQYTTVSDVRLVCTSAKDSRRGCAAIYVIDVDLTTAVYAPLPGDVVEVLAPNSSDLPSGDIVAQVCERIDVNPDSWCELHRSPFVPEDHFPPWLPLRQPITIRNLLTYYVDLSSCSYLLRPTFFESLLRIHNNNKRRAAPCDKSPMTSYGTPEMLEECASAETAPHIFRAIMNNGKPLCYPCLVDVLDVFNFVKLPLARLLEISGPLQPKKFSVAGEKIITGCNEPIPAAEGMSDCIQLCIREVNCSRTANLESSQVTGTARTLADLLNAAALDRARSQKALSEAFCGQVSYRLAHYAAAAPGTYALQPNKLFVGTSLFGTTSFARELRRALTDVAHVRKVGSPLILVGAGTGIAPLIAAVHELMQLRRIATEGTSGESTPHPFSCWVMYGVRTKPELVYHNTLNTALKMGAISRYEYALSREQEIDGDANRTNGAHTVVNLLQRHADDIKTGLMDHSAHLFSCGPTKVLQSIRQLLQTRILAELDDDESMREQRVLLLEEKQQIHFDVWSTVSIFE